MNLAEILIYGMATWRVASLFVYEAGPRNIFLKLRYWAGIEHEGMVPDNFLGGVLSCIWCSSIWVAFFFSILWLAFPDWALKLAVFLSFSTVAILLDTFIKRT